MTKKFNMYGVDFELMKGEMGEPSRIASSDIFDVYDRPSQCKIGIWESWNNWFVCQAGSVNFGIRSYSCNFFSIEGIVEFEGERYYLWITKAHNRAHKIVNSVCD